MQLNFPLNLAVHKIAPTIASGCPIILKANLPLYQMLDYDGITFSDLETILKVLYSTEERGDHFVL